VLVLYYQRTCAYCLRVRLALSEKQIPFARRVVEVDERPTELSDVVGRPVPALLDGSLAISDSLIIAEYLEDAFPRPPLRPADARGRAVLRTLLRRVEAELMTPLARLNDVLPAWEKRLGDLGVLLGSEFSLADIWLLSAIEKAEAHGWQMPPALPHLGAWARRLRDRPSVRAERLAGI
jgi:glutathione S-transferase